MSDDIAWPAGPGHHRGGRRRSVGRLVAGLSAVALSASMAVTLAPVAGATGGSGVDRYVATTGSDNSNHCSIEFSPCATIQHAVDEAGDGDTIRVAAGTYAESVTIDKSVTILGPYAGTSPNTGDPLVANAARSAEAIVQPANGDGKHAFTIGSGVNVTISGLTIDLVHAIPWTNAVSTGQSYVRVANSGAGASLNLTNNIFAHAQWATGGTIYYNNSGTGVKVTIADNRFVDAQDASNGVHIPSSAAGTITVNVQRNVWLDNRYSALNFSSGNPTGNKWTITDNWVGNRDPNTSGADLWDQRQAGFLLANTFSNLTVSGNTFKNIEDYAVYFAYGFHGKADVFNNLIDGYNSAEHRAAVLTSSTHGAVDMSAVHFNRNSITNPVKDSVAVDTTDSAGTFDATANWWGQAAGPRLTQIKSTSSVAYDRWCLNPTCTDVSDNSATTIATTSHHPGWGNDPDPSTSGAPVYVANSENGHHGDGALNLVGSPAVDYYHPVAQLPLAQVNQLSFDQKSSGSPALTLQLRIVGALDTAGTATAANNGFASLVWTMPTAAMTGSWATQRLDLTTAKFQSTRAIHGLAQWDGTGMTLGDIVRNNPDATVYMYGVFRGSTNASTIPSNGTNDALVDNISFNRAVTDFELDNVAPAPVSLISRPSAKNGWSADNTAPTYTTSGPTGASGSGSLNVSVTSTSDHADYFHSVDPTNTAFDMHSTTVMPPTVPLVGAQGLGFKFKVQSGSSPAYQLRLLGTTSSSAGGYTALNWEPAYNTLPAADANGWVTVADLEGGKWWSTKTISGLTAFDTSGRTLAQIAFANPNAVIYAYGVNLGSGAIAGSTDYVDDVTFARTTTDFEPDINGGGGNNNGGNGGSGNAGGGGGGGGGGSTPADDGIDVLGATDRISGNDRYETSALISDFFGTANAVIIANGSTAKNGADALAANYLAGRVNAPILLTEAGTVPPSVLTAVKTVLAGSASPTIYVMGKSDSVSDAAANAIKAAAASVATGTVKLVRVAGNDRYETSAAAAQQTGEVQSVKITKAGAAAKTAILTSGTVNADPLSAAPISYAMGLPVLLTNGTTLDPAVKAAITELGITQLVVLGGTDRVSAAVVTATGIAASHVVRISGANRYATSAALYTFALTVMDYHEGADTDTYLGNALGGFPDVLSAGPLAGKDGAAVLTVADGTGLDPAVQQYFKDHSTADVTALGGTDRVSAAQVTLAISLANS